MRYSKEEGCSPSSEHIPHLPDVVERFIDSFSIRKDCGKELNVKEVVSATLTSQDRDSLARMHFPVLSNYYMDAYTFAMLHNGEIVYPDLRRYFCWRGDAQVEREYIFSSETTDDRDLDKDSLRWEIAFKLARSLVYRYGSTEAYKAFRELVGRYRSKRQQDPIDVALNILKEEEVVVVPLQEKQRSYKFSGAIVDGAKVDGEGWFDIAGMLVLIRRSKENPFFSLLLAFHRSIINTDDNNSARYLLE